MNIISINTFEDIHHVCLMCGLRNAFRRFPFLVDNVMAPPPPVRRNPGRPRLLIGFRRNPVNIQYYRKCIQVLYDVNRTNTNEVAAFAKAVLEEYLSLRHPYMKTAWNSEKLEETASGHMIAEVIIAENPAPDDML